MIHIYLRNSRICSRLPPYGKCIVCGTLIEMMREVSDTDIICSDECFTDSLNGLDKLASSLFGLGTSASSAANAFQQFMKILP